MRMIPVNVLVHTETGVWRVRGTARTAGADMQPIVTGRDGKPEGLIQEVQLEWRRQRRAKKSVFACVQREVNPTWGYLQVNRRAGSGQP